MANRLRKAEDSDQSLALWKDVHALLDVRFDNWQNRSSALLDSMITSYTVGSTVKIRDIYKRNFNYFDGSPDFGDIMQDINDYNYDITVMMSNIQYEAVGHPDIHNKEEALGDIQMQINDFSCYNSFGDLENYVYRCLVELEYFFLIPSNYYSHEALFGDAVITVNDCQNILFPEFLECVSHEVYSFYPSIETKLMVWGGEGSD